MFDDTCIVRFVEDGCRKNLPLCDPQTNVTQNTTHLYGCTETDIHSIATVIGPLLELQLESRDSMYWGDYHIDRSGRFNELRLYRNRDPLFRSDSDDPEDFWFEPEFPECDVLLSVYGTESALHEFHHRIAGVTPEFRLLKPSAIKA